MNRGESLETCKDDQATVRPANPGDAERIATLCQQLGYPVSQQEVRWRLGHIHREERHIVYVAELSNGYVVGCVHVFARLLLLVDLHAEVGALVIDEGYQGRGIGRLLMQHTEQWARQQGCWAVYLRSNIVRKEAHLFYERIGYKVIKTSLTFFKALP